MCVTPFPAEINETRVCVYDTGMGRHNVYYHNRASNRAAGPNCMFVNIAGQDLATIDGPQRTRRFIYDLTSYVEVVDELESPMRGSGSRSVRIMEYGDSYTLLLAKSPADILSVLGEVRPDRRPQRNAQLERLVEFYTFCAPHDSFILACFDGNVKPDYPIALSYVPNDASVLTAPGLDGHDGGVPVIDASGKRDFRVAFGAAGLNLTDRPRYNDDGVSGQPWAPTSVCGFWDYTRNGPNRDYCMPLQALRELNGVRFDDVDWYPEEVYGRLI